MWHYKFVCAVVLLTFSNSSLAQYGTKGGRKPSQQTSAPAYAVQEGPDDFVDFASFEEPKPVGGTNYGTGGVIIRSTPPKHTTAKSSKQENYAPGKSYASSRSRALYSGVQYVPSSTPSTISDNFKLAAKQAKKLAASPNKKISVLAEIQPVDEDEEETLPADLLFDQPSSYVRTTPKPRSYLPSVKPNAKSYATKPSASPLTGYGLPLAQRRLISALYGGQSTSTTPAPLFFDEPQIEQQNEQLSQQQQQELDEFPEEQQPENYARADYYNKPTKKVNKPNYVAKPNGATSIYKQTPLNFDQQQHEEEQTQAIDDDFFDEQEPKINTDIVQQEIDHVAPVSYGKPSYSYGQAKSKFQPKSKPAKSYTPEYLSQSYDSLPESKPTLSYNGNTKSYNSQTKPKKAYAPTPNYGIKGKPNQHGTKGISQVDVSQVGNGVAFKMMEFSMGPSAEGVTPKTYTPDYSPAKAYSAPTGRAYDAHVTTNPTPLVEEVPFEEDDFLQPLEPVLPQDEAEDELNNAELNVELLNPITLEPVSAASRQNKALARRFKAASTAVAANSGGPSGYSMSKPKNKYITESMFLKEKARAKARAAASARARAAAGRAKAKAKAKARAASS